MYSTFPAKGHVKFNKCSDLRKKSKAYYKTGSEYAIINALCNTCIYNSRDANKS